MPDVIARKIESQFEIHRSDSILVDINSAATSRHIRFTEKTIEYS